MDVVTQSASYWVATLGKSAMIEKCRLLRSVEGKCFLDFLSDDASRKIWKVSYSECFAFGVDVDNIAVNVRIDRQVKDIICSFEDIGDDHVTCYMTRRYDLNKLTTLEKNALLNLTNENPEDRFILFKLADPNFSPDTIAELSGMTRASVLSAKRRIEEKLKISRPEGLRLAAAQLIQLGYQN